MKTIENKGKFVAYYRVSTERQGVSGLGLDAQSKTVRDYLNGGKWELVGEFVEVISGKREDRPELNKALTLAKNEGATVIVAKMDRLGRKASHLLSMLDKSGVRFVFAEMPYASELEIGIRAVVAQEESRLISARTKAALQAAKARGVKLGKHGVKLAATNKAAANDRAADLKPFIEEIRASGIVTVRGICDELNRRGIPSARGGKWFIPQTHRVLKRMAGPRRNRRPSSKAKK